MSPIAFVPLEPAAVETVDPWFEDEETRRWLGGPAWPRRVVRLAADQSRAGPDVRGRFALIASQHGEAVGLVDLETYEDGTASVALVVAPERRRRGLGRAIVSALLGAPDLNGVRVLRAGTELANEAGVRCLRAAGFVLEPGGADSDGVVYFKRTLGSAS